MPDGEDVDEAMLGGPSSLLRVSDAGGRALVSDQRRPSHEKCIRRRRDHRGDSEADAELHEERSRLEAHNATLKRV